MKDSKFGKAFVLETVRSSGREFVLGFRIDPIETLHSVYKEVKSLHQLFSKNPIFGVEFDVEEKAPNLEQVTVKHPTETVQYTGSKNTVDPLVSYSVDSNYNENEEREIEFNHSLGLACEKLPDKMSIHQLWECVHKV
jgi:Bardet-Biedl syndrome 5 protein